MGNTPTTAMAKLAAVQAEAASFGVVSVDVRGETIEVLPLGEWPMDALEDLQAGGRTKDWARDCLTSAGWEIWQRIRPTVDETLEFFAKYSAETGQDLGK